MNSISKRSASAVTVM